MSSPSAHPPLACSGVCYRYLSEQPWIIDHFTHIFPPGIILIKGASGCGKSTLLRLMAGYLTPAVGTITTPMGGPATDREYQRRDLGFVFQQLNLLPLATVMRNLTLAGSLAGLSSKQIDERAGKWLRLLGIEAFAARLPKTLSGGQQQRATIARALVKEPLV